MQKTLKRILMFTLALIMTGSLVVTGWAVALSGLTDTNIGLDYANSSSSDSSWTASGTGITGKTAGKFQNNSSTLTITNNLEDGATLSFDFSYTITDTSSGAFGTAGKVTISGTDYTASSGSGAVSVTLNQGDSITVYIQSGTSVSATGTTTVNITNITLAPNTSITTTFQPAAEGGSYTVSSTTNGSKTISAETALEQQANETYALTATAASGYQFFGWHSSVNGYLAYSASYTLTSAVDQIIKPVFVKSSTALFGVGTAQFYDLNEADAYATSSGIKKIVLLNNGTLSAASYTISSGNTLLIPFDSANTIYTTKPGMEYRDTNVTPFSSAPYRTLTMAAGSSITVNGAISVSSKIASGGGSQQFAGSPLGPHGCIKMESSSAITVNNGGALYAWGYVYGSGAVTAEGGSTIYECLQVADFRGGNATTQMTETVFPFSQYYAQNIEVPLTLKSGATEMAFTSIYMSSVIFYAEVPFIGPSGSMFTLSSGYVVKDYDEARDRLHLDVYGDMTLNPISLKTKTDNILLSGQNISVDSNDFDLPINGNITINIHSGTTSVGQNVALLPGAEMSIDEAATLDVNSGYSVYVYDAEQWKSEYIHNAVGASYRTVLYSPGRIATENRLKDVVIDVNGTVNANGYLYTTAGGASIISSGGTGVINTIGGAGESPWTYQALQDSGNSITQEGIDITPAKLHNGGGDYTLTDDAVAGDTYYWSTTYNRWVKDRTIYFNANLGSNTMTPQTVEAGVATTLTANSFTRTGYTFTGWNTAADGSGTSYADKASITLSGEKCSIILCAQWTPTKYTVTFSGAEGVTPITAAYNSSITLPKPTKSGYTFQGWALTDGGNVAYAGGAAYTIPANNVTLYAVWAENQYTVTFDANGGEGTMANQTIGEVTASALTANSFSRSGYTFSGWATSATGDVVYQDKQSITVSAGTTLYAVWVENQYTVTFNANGGTGTMDSQTIGEVTASALTANSFSKEHYTFAGWATSATGDVVYQDKQSITVSADTTLYAVWAENQYTVTFDANGGEGTMAAQDIGEVSYSPLTANSFSRTGYTFSGWNTAADGSGTSYANGASITLTGNITLFAQWSANTYTITFSDAEGVSPIAAAYNSSITLPAPTKTGYTFSGWALTGGGNVAYVGGADYKIAGDATLYAVWAENQYTVTFDANGGTGTMANQTIGEVTASALTANSFSRTGYTFSGWNTAADGSGTSYANGASITLTGNITLFAQWSANTYTVTWVVGDSTSTESYKYGETLTVPAEPTKAADKTYTYTFAGWDAGNDGEADTLPATVTGNATYTAVFGGTYIEYTVKFVNEDGTELSSKTYHYGDTVAEPEDDPTKKATAQYSYTFAGWSPAVTTVTGEATYTATYTETVNKYTVKFVNEDGTQMQSGEVAYGETPSYTGETPTKAADAQYSYTFAGWTPEIAAVTGEATYTATYTETVNTYTVTWVNEDGTVLETDKNVPYGTTPTYDGAVPTKAGNAQYSYTFAGWDKTVEAVNGNVTYKATYTETVNKYTIKFVNEDGTQMQSGEVAYGETPSYTGETPTKAADTQYSYTFAGWKPEIAAVTGEATYTATYTRTPVEYKLTWVIDGETTTETVAYGSDITAPAAPTKTGYTFAGWEGTIPATMPAEETTITLTSRWTANAAQYTVETYTMGLDGQYGEPEKETIGSFTDEDITLMPEAKTGFTVAEESVLTGKVAYDNSLVLKVYYSRNQYTITFDTDGGSEVAAITQDYGTAVTAPADPTKEGYTFAGWDKEIPGTMGAENVTIKARWTVNQYTITFKNESEADKVITVVYGTKITEDAEYPADPTKDGWKFAGWEGLPVNMPAKNLTVTATWSYNQYVVTFDANGGAGTMNALLVDIADSGNTTATLTGNTYSKTGYTFAGWDTNDDGTVDYEDGAAITLTSDVKLKAVWSVDTYTITWDMDGVVFPIGYEYGAEVTAPFEISSTGYTFAGWYNGEKEVEFPFIMPAEDLTFTPKWTANQYTITFDTDGGSAVAAITQDYGTAVTAPVNPTKEGYSFAGWDVEIPETMPAENVTITAQWTVNQYTITFDTDGGSAVTAITQDYGTAVTAPAAPTKEGYTFAGWDVEIPETMPAENVTITAQWTVNQYTVTFLDEDGTTLSTQTVPYGSRPTAPTDPTKAADETYSYTFAGWTPAVSAVTGNATYTATYTGAYIDYTVVFRNWDGTQISSTAYHYGDEVTVPADPTREADAQYTYTFKGWDKTVAKVSGNVTYTATYNATVNQYTVTWLDEDGETLLHTDTLDYGAMPVYDGPTPTKSATAQYTYSFDKWTPAIKKVSGNATYTAAYSATVNRYTVTWVNEDGAVLETDSNVPYGTMPAYNSAMPAKAADAQYTYTFKGWDKTVEAVTGNVTYKATYNATVNQYTVTWLDEDGKTVLATDTLDYGAMPSYDGETPIKSATAQYTYSFAGWDKPLARVSGNATYIATYSATVNQYTVTWVDEDGKTILATDTLDYGAMPSYGGATPTKAADAQYTYTFDKWSPVVSAVTGETTYTATYSAAINKYTVTWVNEDGTELEKDENVPYGTTPAYNSATPTKSATAQYAYSFDKWTPAIEKVTGNATYTATYSATVNRYMVIWLDADGTELEKDENVPYGTLPAFDGAVPTKSGNAQYSYTFAGWDADGDGEVDDVSVVGGNAAYTAVYTQSTNQYTVTWVNADGTELEKDENVPYGTTPTYNGATPTKAADAQYTYSFDKWSPAVSAVTGDVTYTAAYSTTVNTYTITWLNEDGSVFKTETNVPYGTTVVFRGIRPTKAATAQYTYTFAAWLDAKGNVLSAESTVTGDMTYKASFSATINEYSVSLIYNADNYTDETKTLSYGEKLTLPAPSNDSYHFLGWATEADGDVVYAAGAELTIEGETTVYGVWEEKTYTVTFNANGGTGTMTEQTIGAVTKSGLSTNTFTRTGYTFTGWAYEAEGTVMLADGAEITCSSSVELYAVWTINSYTVTWILDGQESQESYQYGAAITAPAAPAKEGHTFTGWVGEIPKTMGAGDISVTLTSSWSVNSYTVTWILDGQESQESYQYGAAITAPAAPAKEGHTFTGWVGEIPKTMGAEDISVTLESSWSVNSYTITWIIDGQESQEGYQYGEAIAMPAEPTREGYTFTGWDKEIPETMGAGDATIELKATWSVNYYTVTWLDADGTVLATESVAYGRLPALSGNEPVKPSTAEQCYVFLGWDANGDGEEDEVMVVTGDSVYIAVYDVFGVSYQVFWRDEDGTLLASGSAAYGTTPTYSGPVPTKAADAQYTYTFSKWTPEVDKVKGNVTYFATYRATVNTYMVTWLDADGTVLEKDEKVPYGTLPVYDGAAPTKAADAQYTYTFDKWTPAVSAVTGDVVYTATYTAQVNRYTVTWLDADGTVLKTESVAYGIMPTAPAAPTKAADAQYTYTFDKWTPAVSAVTGDVVYTATYTAQVNRYTVMWLDADGTVLKTESVAYGIMPTAPAEPTKAADKTYTYTFDKWTPMVDEVTGDVSYTASYKRAYISYTVTFQDWDGTVISRKTYHYGDTVVVPDAPEREDDANGTYSFAGWDKTVTNVSGDAVYTATYTWECSEVIRVFGADRYATAFDVAEALKEQLGVEKFDTIVVASGANFADALSGSYLANKRSAPILLVSSGNMAEVKAYIKNNLVSGGTVYLLGGTGSVPAGMETGLDGFAVKRLAGATRYETNLAILAEAGVENEDILICTGTNFADCLSASAAGRPILLVSSALSAEQKAFLASVEGNPLYILGGTGSVSEALELEVAAYGAVTRIGGATRYETSVMIAEAFFGEAKQAVLAYAQNFPDGLSGGALAYSMNAPLILTATGQESAAAAYAAAAGTNSGMVLGGPTFIGDDAVRTIFRMAADAAIRVFGQVQ